MRGDTERQLGQSGWVRQGVEGLAVGGRGRAQVAQRRVESVQGGEDSGLYSGGGALGSILGRMWETLGQSGVFRRVKERWWWVDARLLGRRHCAVMCRVIFQSQSLRDSNASFSLCNRFRPWHTVLHFLLDALGT